MNIPHTEKSKRKMSISALKSYINGKQPPMYWLGKKQSKEMIEKRRLAMIGKNKDGNGRPNWTEEQKKSFALKMSGPNNPRWQGGYSKSQHKGIEYNAWRNNIYTRDGFKCKMLNHDCSGKIEAHHILSFTKFPELRYQINNGITLCQAHHPRKRAEEARLAPVFRDIIFAIAN